MSRLPNPGGDDGQWGAILNDFLGVEHNADGTLKQTGNINTAVSNAATALSTANSAASAAAGAVKSVNGNTPNGSGAVTLTATDVGAPTTLATLTDVNASGAADAQVLTFSSTSGKWTAATVTSSGTVNNASNTGLGIIQLAGDLAGNNNPAAPAISNGAITDAKVSGSAAIAQSKINGLTTSLAAKAPVASPTFSGTVTVPTPSNSTDAATKGYVDTTISSATIADASTTVKGKVQLAGDLAGTAAAPSVAKVNGVAISGTPSNGQVLTATSANAAAWAIPSGGVVSSVAGRTGAVSLGESDIANLTTDLAAKATDSVVVHTTGTETVAGVKTFSSSPIVPLTPTTSTQAASKGYVDTQVSGVSGGAGRTVTAVKTSAYTPAAGQYVIVNSTGGGFNVTMPTGQASGACISFKSISTNLNAVVILPGGSDHIEDQGNYDGISVSLNSGQTDMDFVYDGVSRWYRVG